MDRLGMAFGNQPRPFLAVDLLNLDDKRLASVRNDRACCTLLSKFSPISKPPLSAVCGLHKILPDLLALLGANAMAMKNKQTRDANPDPITGEPGSHPVGTGIGAAITGAAAGMAGGALGGPIGAAVGAAVGAVAGGYAGKAVEEELDPTAEDAYWRANYRNRPYIDKGTDYDAYRPAYQYGWESRSQHRGRRFEDVETDLKNGWQSRADKSNLSWDKAKLAAHDAWDRIDRPNGR